ncbi:tetraspanin-15 isoform X3 [Polyodon spathula]|uniref:tetraspanin-15 isoform X3 n=1 Tax=Polyodon spathula TaxID=7913 RepID=UPI001B7E4A92|nr:tetraspanin-15 isoform X3 [Polyodon spathula]
MPSFSEWSRSFQGYYLIKFTLNVYSMMFSFFCVLSVLLALQTITVIIALLFENNTSSVFQSSIREGIKHYYDDLDFKNILDFVQEKFSCCGGDEYRDWAVNQYHSCNGTGPRACGVPYTCCPRRKVEGVVNTLCGYKTLDKERLQLVDVIYVRGCIHAVYLWFGDNMGATIGLCCALFLPQLFGIILTCLFWTKLKELSEHTADQVDFKALRRSEFQYSELDLSGAGWCLCLPRDGGYLPVPESEPDLWSPEPENLDEPPIEIVPVPRTSPDLSRTKQNLGLDEVDFRV